MDNLKHKELLKKKEEAIEKLNFLYKGFHGVRHEDSASEIRYTQIKVLEDYINSINEELKIH
ncbi:MAG: hypothetical protein AAB656_01785 [Patescibacteria group bacterium]